MSASPLRHDLFVDTCTQTNLIATRAPLQSCGTQTSAQHAPIHSTLPSRLLCSAATQTQGAGSRCARAVSVGVGTSTGGTRIAVCTSPTPPFSLTTDQYSHPSNHQACAVSLHSGPALHSAPALSHLPHSRPLLHAAPFAQPVSQSATGAVSLATLAAWDMADLFATQTPTGAVDVALQTAPFSPTSCAFSLPWRPSSALGSDGDRRHTDGDRRHTDGIHEQGSWPEPHCVVHDHGRGGLLGEQQHAQRRSGVDVAVDTDFNPLEDPPWEHCTIRQPLIDAGAGADTEMLGAADAFCQTELDFGLSWALP
jgi:hypothetical protein